MRPYLEYRTCYVEDPLYHLRTRPHYSIMLSSREELNLRLKLPKQTPYHWTTACYRQLYVCQRRLNISMLWMPWESDPPQYACKALSPPWNMGTHIKIAPYDLRSRGAECFLALSITRGTAPRVDQRGLQTCSLLQYGTSAVDCQVGQVSPHAILGLPAPPHKSMASPFTRTR